MKKFTLLMATALASLTLLSSCGSQSNDAKNYEIYPTKNMWTFVKLDTRNGMMWQMQFTLKDEAEYRYATELSTYDLNTTGPKNKAGRYELHETQNMYNFILLDTHTGRSWQVQWSTEAKNRGIIAEIE
ncbi:MAG: hypothetical protein IIV29_03565 [Tidjanibacter sp.]|nr:hypothetical protein [Tidjanibacter sp.]